MTRVFNFSAGPSQLPTEVLQKCAAELMEYGISGQSVMEMLSLIHISEPTRQAEISYAVFCLKKKKTSP